MRHELKPRLTLWVELSEACQLKCRFCYNGWRDSPSSTHRSMDEVGLERLLRLCRQLIATHDLDFALAGGDATAHPELIPITIALSKFGRIHLVTHGAHLTSERLAQLAEIPAFAIQFSIPSADPGRYRHLTGGGTLQTVVNAAVEARRRGMAISTSAVITALNVEDGPDLVRLTRGLGGDHLILNRYLEAGRGALYAEAFQLSDEAFTLAAERTAAAGRAAGLRVMVSGDLRGIRTRKVLEPKITISITGQARVCSLDMTPLAGDDAAAILQAYGAFWDGDDRLESCVCSNALADERLVQA